jgi:GT2 family glycosyltransferase/glycosyltransferase involved in cell wall biosynthesis
LTVSIIIPVIDKLAFTRQCLDRIARNTSRELAFEVIVVDNDSSDGTREYFSNTDAVPVPVRYHRNAANLGFARANNIGAGLARGEYLLFLNNDTLVQPGWLTGMLRLRRSDPSIGIVGIKQLFPYTNVIYHTGVVFAPGGHPVHLHPHLDASVPYVNKEREYQAVNGACLLIDRSLFEACGGFDEGYRNGYEDTDLCLAAAARGRKTVCCTSAFIYHYGQISEGRTSDDPQNAARFAQKWGSRVRADRDEYLARDRAGMRQAPRSSSNVAGALPPDAIYFADDMADGSAQTWVNAELALTLEERGVPVLVNGPVSPTVPASARKRLQRLSSRGRPTGGTQIKWSHYRPRHLNTELTGAVNLEIFVVNYVFGSTGIEPWDYWLQCLRQNGHAKLPVSDFCRDVLLQIGVPAGQCHILYHGYSREIPDVEPPARRTSTWRFLTVTNSHDLGRYNTEAILQAYDAVFRPQDDVALVIKDYGASSGDTTLRRVLAERRGRAAVEYVTAFTDKRELIRLYKSCDAFVSAHRGEGFGMKILDAMACALPVVTPLFGGPTAYCRADNCYPVEFALVPMGDCLDGRSLHVTNQPMWAEVDRTSLGRQLRRTFDDRREAARVAAAGRDAVLQDFTWARAADRLTAISTEIRDRAGQGISTVRAASPAPAERSPYWLGLRVSVVVPTRNRKQKLLACLDALARQSILPQEYEVLVIDDGSSDGTREMLEARRFPFALRYYRQEAAGPGTARNLGVQHADGELVLFIGDDIYAGERLLEEHLLAHATEPAVVTAILGHIDWPSSMEPNEVMRYVCGDAMLQFAYSYIPHAPELDHRFFYTSNISLKRAFLLEAARAGIGFDPDFGRAAFEDSEYALRLTPRGLRIRYAERARAVHDHWMDLESFARREHAAGEMSVVFYRKHPGQDDLLQVRWLADLVGPAAAVLGQPDLLRQLEQFDAETDTLLSALAGSLEGLLALERTPNPAASMNLSPDRLRAALHNVFRVVFDVERTRGKVAEWYAGVQDPARVRAAQTLAAILRKTEFLQASAERTATYVQGNVPAAATLAGLNRPVTDGVSPGQGNRRSAGERVRRLIANPSILVRLVAVDRFVEARLHAIRPSWLANYRRVRGRIRRALVQS